LLDWFNRSKMNSARRSGKYPTEGKESDEDVLRLALDGQKIMAIKLYREIHGVGLKEAKEAVEGMTQGQK
ncbi:ribosomal protein L7/L12, partial [Oligoflexia bacterium]|nr:ribosomal protein L7/L12 [Oligoflexia bacterium]